MVIDEQLARALIDAQFPQWRGLDVRQVLPGGWDNRTFRLGEELLMRLPSADGYAAAVAKEQRWLPVIASAVPVAVPLPVAQGAPSDEFDRPWSVYRWIEGMPLADARFVDLTTLAVDLARFLTALSTVDTHGAPRAGEHSFWRGAHPRVYSDDVQRCLDRLEGRIDTTVARSVWEAALGTEITSRPVWFHGDVSPGNVLLRDGRLCAVIDFGTSGVGDPACDLAIAWTVLDDSARQAFRDALPWDEATWTRGRAWALWKTMLTLTDPSDTHDPAAESRKALAVIDRILQDAG
jgi:aminoglycoside phosphotransferase (APT) family kinase protein